MSAGRISGTVTHRFTGPWDRSAGSGCGAPPPRHPPRGGRSRARWCGCRCGRRIRALRAKHSHNAPQVSGYPASAAPPTIAVAALLGLARWCRQRSDVPGDPSCGDRHPQQRPPPVGREKNPVKLIPPLWDQLTQGQRDHLASLVGRLLARHLQTADRREVSHDSR